MVCVLVRRWNINILRGMFFVKYFPEGGRERVTDFVLWLVTIARGKENLCMGRGLYPGTKLRTFFSMIIPEAVDVGLVVCLLCSGGGRRGKRFA